MHYNAIDYTYTIYDSIPIFCHWWLLMPIRIPSLGCGEEGNLIQCKTAQLWYSMSVKQPWDQAPRWLDSPLIHMGLLCAVTVFSVLHWRFTLLWWDSLSSFREMQYSVFGGKGKCTLWARGELVYTDRRPRPWSLIGLVVMQVRTPNSHSLIGPKGTVLISQNRPVLIGQWRGWWG